MREPVTCFIGLGSNLEQPENQILQAFEELNALPDTQLLTRSSLYHSSPVGPADQPDFINAVARLNTLLPPIELLDALQAIEQAHQRIRERHWGPRTLDLDLLLYGNQTIAHPRLTVPHKEMTQRGFVLVPLLEIAPALCLPNGTALADSLTPLDTSDIRRF